MKYVVTLALVLALLSAFSQLSQAACCDWSDKEACSSCPPHYFSGCRTEGNKCSCDCSETADGLIARLAKDENTRAYLEQKMHEAKKGDTKELGVALILSGGYKAYGLPPSP